MNPCDVFSTLQCYNSLQLLNSPNISTMLGACHLVHYTSTHTLLIKSVKVNLYVLD